MPARQPFLEPGTVVADYEVKSLIARGGMGEVYLARDVRLDRRVALKVLPAELSGNDKFRARFVRESKLAASVDHPNIIPVYGAGDVDGQLYIAMRYVPGADLHSELARHGPLDLPTALGILNDAAAALDAAHDAGLIHRDVKPANILLAAGTGPRPHVYLSDFGLTRRSTSASGLTTTGHFMGTLDYVAPEQIRGGAVDERADVYALACVAFEMLAGRPPFQRDDDTALLWAHVFESPPRVCDLRPELPAAVDLAIAAGLEKAPADRPRSCGELVARMDDAADLGPAAPSAAAPTPAATPAATPADAQDARSRLPRPHRRRRTAIVTGGMLAVLATSALLWVTRPTGGADQVTFDEPGIPYTLQVPAEWTPRRSEAGDSTITVLSGPDLRGLFDGDPAAAAAAAKLVREDPASVTGLTVYHRPFLAGLSPVDKVATAEALLPGQARLVDRGRAPAGEVGSQVMEGTTSLSRDTLLQTEVRAVGSDPEQLLVFFAPPSVFADEQTTFAAVVDSLQLKAGTSGG